MIKAFDFPRTLHIHKEVVEDYYNRLLYENLNQKTERPVLYSSIEFLLINDQSLKKHEYLMNMLERAKKSDVVLEQLCVTLMLLWRKQ